MLPTIEGDPALPWETRDDRDDHQDQDGSGYPPDGAATGRCIFIVAGCSPSVGSLAIIFVNSITRAARSNTPSIRVALRAAAATIIR
jgi:hypothetical protein